MFVIIVGVVRGSVRLHVRLIISQTRFDSWLRNKKIWYNIQGVDPEGWSWGALKLKLSVLAQAGEQRWHRGYNRPFRRDGFFVFDIN